MSLSIGEKAPNFILPTTSGSTIELYKDYKEKPLIIYFYPKDFTFGCTNEACDFRDSFNILKQLDIDVIGISKDAVSTHIKFKKEHNLPFHLATDKNLIVAKEYKALIPVINFPKRVSYLLNRNQIIIGVYDNLLKSSSHIKQMLKMVKSNDFKIIT